MSFDERLTTRSSGVLSAMIASLGNESAVLRALVIIGLHTCGKNIQVFTADALASVARLDDHAVRDTLLAVLMKPVEQSLHPRSPMLNLCCTPVHRLLNNRCTPVHHLLNISQFRRPRRSIFRLIPSTKMCRNHQHRFETQTADEISIGGVHHRRTPK